MTSSQTEPRRQKHTLVKRAVKCNSYMVDPEQLSALWRSPRRKALTFALLQQVWLSTGATSCDVASGD